jgi:hypothetical protein
MNDDGALAAIIIGQWMTVLLLTLILWRISVSGKPLLEL